MNNQDQQAGGDAVPPITAHGAARRRFARAGAGITGALVTISSKAGMAVEVCASPSGGSGGLQSPATNTEVACAGRSPGYWKNHTGWPVNRLLAFGAVFNCDLGSPYNTCSLEDILKPQDWDKYGLGRHMAATYLNVESGKIGFLTGQQLQRMWNELRGGYYRPKPGVDWDAEDVVEYLQGTMGSKDE